jgi:type I restriction-modification system DNA methylase subunit
MKDYYKATIGIEKEYRLCKIAKVSAFMYGQNEIQIINTDALAPHDEVKLGSYDILIANPPYSVK